MKSFFFILILFFSCKQLVYGQNYFNKSHTIGYGYGNVLQSGENYYLVGALFNSGGTGSCTIVKSDSLGNVIWVDTVSQYPIVTTNGILSKVDDGYVFCSLINQINPYIDSNNNILLRKYDTNWGIVYERILGGVNQDVVTDFKLCADKGFAIAATSGSFGDLDGDFYLIKTDSLGIVEWEQNYGGSDVDVANSMSLCSDGGYILSGYSRSYSPSTDCLVIKTDSIGNQEWVKHFGMSFSDNGGMIIELADKTFLVSTAFRSSANQLDAMLLKLAYDGQVIWQKTFPISDYSSLNIPITKNPDGTVIVGGIMHNSQNSSIGRILKIDPLGNEVWERQYETHPNKPQYIYGLKHTSDNGYIFCGSAFDTNEIWSPWVVKLDCFGCDSTLCYYPDSVCDFYDCSQFPISANFTVSDDYLNLAYGEDTVSFVNSSANTTNRVWDFGNDSIAYTDSVFTQVYNTVGTYDVSLIVYHGMCSDTLVQTVTVVNDLGLTEWEREWERVLIYPNPNQGSFTVSNHTNKAFEIEVTDALGKLVYKQKLEESDELIQTVLTNGVYLVKFIHPDKVFQRRIVIQK